MKSPVASGESRELIRWPFIGIAYAVLLGMVLTTRFNAAGNLDVSWLMVAAEKWWHHGAIFGIDIVEPAPPSVMLLYLPGLWLSDLTHLPPLWAADIWVSVLLLLCAQLIGLVYAHHEKLAANAPEPILAFIFSFSILAFSPTQDFGERDLIIAALILPYALYHAGDGNMPASGRLRLIVAVAAILGACIKPQYALLVVAVFVLRIVRLGPIKGLQAADAPLFIVSGLAYIVGTYLFFPEWSRLAPERLAVYDTYKMALDISLVLIFGHTCLVGALLAISKLKFAGSRYLLAGFLLSAATLLIALIEQRPWGYHLMPIVLVGLVSLSLIAVQSLKYIAPLATHKAWVVLLVVLIPLYLGHKALVGNATDKQLFYASDLFKFFRESAGPGEPIAFMSLALSPAFPLVHAGEYSWASRFPCLWTLSGLMVDIPENSEKWQRRQTQVDSTISAVAEDLRSFVPVAIAIQDEPGNLPLTFGWPLKSFLDRNPDFRMAMRDYVYRGRIGNHLVYLHSDRAAQILIDRRHPPTGR